MSNNVLSVENISVRVKRRRIIKNLSLTIGNGEIVGLLGPNGSGKTTTIKAMAGLLKKESGVIHCLDYDMDLDFENYIKQIGFGFDKANYYPNLSGRDNIKIFVSSYRDFTEEELNKCVKEVGLQRRIDDKVSTYSFGMRQRLNFAKSIMTAAKLVVLDEPFNGIDPEGIIEIRKTIMQLRKDRGMAFLVSSHHLSEIEQIADRLLFFAGGRVEKEIFIHENTWDNFTITIGNSDNRFTIDLFPNSAKVEFLSKNAIRISNKYISLDQVLSVIRENGYIVKSVDKSNALEDIYIQTVGGGQIE
jgi:ABC-2 type transport system ATP-binding protein